MHACILASASPRRRALLRQLGLPLEVFASDVDERSDERDPGRLSEELSARKGRATIRDLQARQYDLRGRLVIASDTTVFCEGEILGKPRDEADARRMLRLLSGKRHTVVSGIYLCLDGKEALSHETTAVEFAPLSEQEIDFYIRSGEPFGKAGAYAIQGLAAAFIRGIEGDFYNVVGLPLCRMCALYREAFGVDLLPFKR